MITVIGHEQRRKMLDVALRGERLPHAMLFSGPQASGKRLVALELAEKILLRQDLGKRESDVIEAIRRGEHPDLHTLSVEEDKKDISIDQVRTLIGELSLRPYFGNCRVAIIDNAHLLSQAAQNALLLTLEEAPSGCFLILVTHLPHRLLGTIMSRVHEISFGSLTRAESKEILAALTSEEGSSGNIELSLEFLNLESFRTSVMEQLKYSKAIAAHIAEFEQRTKRLATIINRTLSAASLGERLSAASELADKSHSHTEVFQVLLSSIRNQLLHAGSDEEVTRIASNLLKSLETERLIATRNLNAPIQLSALFSGL